ncbi:MAG: thiamine diphosphokinase [Caldilineales bacterium]|nr:thiamine diphosphokinase [Caldilineales bacterium]
MRSLIFANGDLPDLDSVRPRLRPDDLVICADGGARHALALGLIPDLLVGDLDSIADDDLAQLEAQGVPIERYPVDKNYTDLELAVMAAQRLGVTEALILAALGGRLDQTLANLMLLAGDQFSGLTLSLADGPQTAWIVRDRIVINGQIGDTLSTLALTPQVEGLTYSGLRWPLSDFTLAFGSTRGVSNEMLDARAEITISNGILLVIHIPSAEFPT